MATSPNLSKDEGLIRTHELFDQLYSDVNNAFEMLENNKESQYLRRTLVRTVFSFIEGVINVLKFEICTEYRRGKTKASLTKKEREILFETKERDGEKIKIFIATDTNLKKTFSIAKKAWSLKIYQFNSGGSEYEHFLQAKKARDRLTHPRTFYDVEISDVDMACMASSFWWVKNEFHSLMTERIEKISKGIPDDILSKLLNKTMA